MIEQDDIEVVMTPEACKAELARLLREANHRDQKIIPLDPSGFVEESHVRDDGVREITKFRLTSVAATIDLLPEGETKP